MDFNIVQHTAATWWKQIQLYSLRRQGNNRESTLTFLFIVIKSI